MEYLNDEEDLSSEIIDTLKKKIDPQIYQQNDTNILTKKIDSNDFDLNNEDLSSSQIIDKSSENIPSQTYQENNENILTESTDSNDIETDESSIVKQKEQSETPIRKKLGRPKKKVVPNDIEILKDIKTVESKGKRGRKKGGTNAPKTNLITLSSQNDTFNYNDTIDSSVEPNKKKKRRLLNHMNVLLIQHRYFQIQMILLTQLNQWIYLEKQKTVLIILVLTMISGMKKK